MRKTWLILPMAAVLALGMPVQSGQMTLDLGMQRAEASMFSKAIGSIGDKVGGHAKKAAKDAVNQAFEINLDGMQNHRADMYNHIMKAAGYWSASEYQLSIATGKSDARMGVLANNLMGADATMDDVAEATSRPRVSNAEVKLALSNLMSSGSKERISQANTAMSYSKHDSVAALIYTGLAARDASFLLKETAKGLAHPNDVNDILDTLKTLQDQAKEVETVVGFVNSKIKERNDARKAYDKANNIKAPSKKEVMAQINEMQAE